MNTEDIQKKLNDKAFRAELRKNPQLVSEIGYDYDENIQYIIKTNTHDKLYLPIDSQRSPNDYINQVQAAGSAGSAGSISCVSSVSTTFGTAGSVSTLGSSD